MKAGSVAMLVAPLVALAVAGCADMTPAAPAIAPAAGDVRAFAAPPAGFADARPGAAQGRIEEFTYDSPVTGTRRKANVYLPAGYTPERRYPVLYLLHGIAGNHEEWRGYVRAHNVIDNVLADGKAVPMIIVMPNGRALPDDSPPPPDRMLAPGHVAGFAQFETELLQTLIPAIDRRYATIPDRRQRAIGGLSMGGGQALNIGVGHPEVFAWVAGFSAAPNTRPAAELLATPALADHPLALLYLSCGELDGLVGPMRAAHDNLTQRGVPHVWHVDRHGHERESWAENLYHFSQRIFR